MAVPVAPGLLGSYTGHVLILTLNNELSTSFAWATFIFVVATCEFKNLISSLPLSVATFKYESLSKLNVEYILVKVFQSFA